MQQFINYWDTTLQEPLLAADGVLRVPAALAQRLAFNPGGFYDLTLDPTGAAPEIVRVTGATGGSLTLGARALEGSTTPASWPAGTRVVASVTAGCLAALQQSAGGQAADRFITATVGVSTAVTADLGLVVLVSASEQETELVFQAPAVGRMRRIDLQFFPGSSAVFRLSLPGGEVATVSLGSGLTEVTGGSVRISGLAGPVFASVLLCNDSIYGPVMDVVRYWSEESPTPPDVPS